MSTALLLIDHGSRNHEANKLLEDVAELVRRRQPDLIVHTAHMTLAAPSIREGFSLCVGDGATEVVVHPYMLSPGRHALEDVPTLVEQAARDFPQVQARITPPLGLHPKLVDVILERAGIVSPSPDRPGEASETP